MIPLAEALGNIMAHCVCSKTELREMRWYTRPVALFERTTRISALHGHSAFNLPLKSGDVQTRVVFVLPLRFSQ